MKFPCLIKTPVGHLTQSRVLGCKARSKRKRVTVNTNPPDCIADVGLEKDIVRVFKKILFQICHISLWRLGKFGKRIQNILQHVLCSKILFKFRRFMASPFSNRQRAAKFKPVRSARTKQHRQQMWKRNEFGRNDVFTENPSVLRNRFSGLSKSCITLKTTCDFFQNESESSDLPLWFQVWLSLGHTNWLERAFIRNQACSLQKTKICLDVGKDHVPVWKEQSDSREETGWETIRSHMNIQYGSHMLCWSLVLAVAPRV